MNLGQASAMRGLPALAGVMLGVYLYAIPFKGATGLPMMAMVTMIVLVVLLLVIANRMFNQRPRLGAALLEPWTLTSVALVATFTGLVLWLTVNLEALLGLPPNQAKAVSGALIGAFTTYAATAWIKDIQEANGFFVTSGQAKLHFKNFAKHHKLVGDSLALDLCQDEKVTTKDEQVEGWGWKARRQRARLLQQFLDGGKKPLPRN